MKLNVYIDDFNFYCVCLYDTPYKWIDVSALCQASFPADRINILHPCSRPGRGASIELRKVAGLRSGKPPLIVQEMLLAAGQFPATMTDATGAFHKPASW